MNIRQAAVAGSFYPQSEHQLLAAITQLMANCTETTEFSAQPKGLIVPHAGYMYSGPIAASAYHQLIPFADTIKRIILLGPSHRVPLTGIALSDSDYFQTPLGTIELDHATIKSLISLEHVAIKPQAHLYEHSLEVQLPFLQYLLDDFTLVPLVVGQISPFALSNIINTLWNGTETLFIISTDLSHFHSYQQAKSLDHATSEAIKTLQINITSEQACGHHPLNGILLSIEKHGMEVTELDIRNSGDTAGSKEKVVGYGAYAFG